MTLPEMLDDLPTDCDVGTKKNSKGYRDTWVGYKLHIDVADGQVPISCPVDLGLDARQPGRHSPGDDVGRADDQLL